MSYQCGATILSVSGPAGGKACGLEDYAVLHEPIRCGPSRSHMAQWLQLVHAGVGGPGLPGTLIARRP